MTGMSVLEAPEAQALLEEALIEPADVADCRRQIEGFVRRYLPLFYRQEQRANVALVIRGRLRGLERKTCEPIARAAGVQRKSFDPEALDGPVQFFVGSGKWDDEAVMRELRAHVAEELADPKGVLVIDGSTFPKKGPASCGVGRQWCGRLGKVENCQTGVFLTYAAAGGHPHRGRRAGRGLLSVSCRAQGAAVEAGAGACRPPPDRGVFGRGQTGGGAGAIRRSTPRLTTGGAELGGLAPSHDAVPVGPVVLDAATPAPRGKKRRRSRWRKPGRYSPRCCASRRPRPAKSPRRLPPC